MNYLFLVNAALLSLLSFFLLFKKSDRQTLIFFFTSMGLALWNVCIFLTEERLFASSVDIISRLQLIFAMVFANGLYYFCASYPEPRKSRKDFINLAVFLSLTLGLLFSNGITEAVLVDDQVVYNDGWGYGVYALYLMILGLSALYSLIDSYRKYPEYRSRIKYFFIGISIYVLSAIVFNLLLPQIQVYDYLIVGRLSATFPPLFFFYAITKHEFLNITVIINKYVAWAVTATLIFTAFLVVHLNTYENRVLNLSAVALLGLLCAGYAKSFQQFLLTSAKRKFIRGWYSTDEVISELSTKITREKNRESIFRTIESVLDKVFEFENSLTVVAVRDDQGNFSYYKMVDTLRRLQNRDPLIRHFFQLHSPRYLEDCDTEVREELERLGYKQNRKCLVLPFHSPEYLEGIIVLGERSTQAPYTEHDMKFFNYLVNYVSPILYRLTPMERLEKLYFENKQKLHEAEIQLIRAQKIESIVHATRQCHHEIRTPLNIIRLGIGRIKTLEDLESYREVALEEITRALEIVEETLTITDVNKPSEDRYSYVDINEVLNRCARLVDQSCYNMVLELGEVPPVWGSFSDIQVAITNLVHNALDAMGGGGNLFMASSFANGSITIDIEDSGKGIPDGLRSKVWEPYYSGHETEVGNSTAGRGWGLTIVNRIVTEHQGTINFTSEEGVGTRFTINLPVQSQSAPGSDDGKVVPISRKAG